MSLAPGTQLGHYEIIAAIGKGGMGEVYRGKDTRLGRDVAIKVSADRFSERFEREARAIAALNHPNICTLYDVGPNYLVMEYIEGEAPSGPMPIEDALSIAKQIAAALQEAHEKRITHRDLKPGNIKVKADGLVKVLDFGLAKIGPAAAEVSEDSPTLTMGGTVAGTILGTAAYMAPEQARGKDVDKRADIWAFGVVLYELLTGQRPFKGEDLGQTLASVVKEPVDLTPIPARVKRLIARCLEKDPKKRLQDIGDFELLLTEEPAPVVAASPASRGTWALAAAVPTLALAALGFVHFREAAPEPQLMRFEIQPPENTTFTGAFALSPDGKTLAFGAGAPDGRGQIWLRSMDSLETRPLKGTDGLGQPIFWSPDSQSIAFSGPPPLAKLMRIDLAGGGAQSLCPAPEGAPVGVWTEDDKILYRGAEGLYQVPARGGNCTLVVALDRKREDTQITEPSMLPDGRHFLYRRASRKQEESGIFIGSLDAKPDQQSGQRLLQQARLARYVPPLDAKSPGYLVFLRDSTLVAQEFDVDKLVLVGDAVPIADNVDAVPASVSNTGALLYRASAAGLSNQLIWRDRSGKPLGTVDQPGNYNSLSISHDGTRVAFSRTTNDNMDIWIHQFSGGTTNRLTFDPGNDQLPSWSADDTRVAYTRPSSLYQKRADLTGDEQLLFKNERPTAPMDFSRDGRFLLFVTQPAPSTGDLWILPLGAGAQAKAILSTQFVESQGRFSPDSRFIAYVSLETGSAEVYVRPISADGTVGAPQMISRGGGYLPLWRADGKELYYLRIDGRVMAVPVSTAPIFKQGPAEELFASNLSGRIGPAALNRWDIAPDGRFLIISTVTEVKSPPLNLVLNWEQLLKRR